jgi:hypothetical protein
MGGLFGAVVTLSLHRWLAEWYQLPSNLLLFIGLANLIYAIISFTLSSMSQGHRVPGLRWMGAANMAWTACCLLIMLVWRSQITGWGIAHLTAEGLFVAALGFLEYRADVDLRRAV